MQRAQHPYSLQALGFGIKSLLVVQVACLILMMGGSVGHVGLGKSLLQHLPVLVSFAVIFTSARAAASGNEIRARTILSFGMLLVVCSALISMRTL